MSDTSKSKDETAAVDAALDAVTSSVTAQVSELNQLTNTSTGRAAMGLDQLLAVGVEVTVEVGRTRSTFAELMKLEPGALLGGEVLGRRLLGAAGAIVRREGGAPAVDARADGIGAGDVVGC